MVIYNHPDLPVDLSGITFGGLINARIINIARNNEGWRKILPIANWNF